MQQKKILIIKFGGLGDVILSLNAMYSIRKKSKKKISLLTEKPYGEFLKKSGWFDEIITINRSIFYFFDIFKVKRNLNINNFSEVYDLQTSKRSSNYLKIFKNDDCTTNGIGKFADIEHTNPMRNKMHTIARQKDQLNLSNVKYYHSPNLNWLYKKTNKFGKPQKYALIVPGGSGKRLNKRIPVKLFFEIISMLIEKKITPFLIGSIDDLSICKKIEKRFPGIKNLCLKTNFFDIASLAKNAFFSIGNDTGPMHIISRANKKTIVLFTENSDPKLCGPIGEKVEILKINQNEEEFRNKVLQKTKKAIS